MKSSRACAMATVRLAGAETGASAAASADPEEKLRFEAELEFVQSLANPEYLHFLAQHRYFDDPAFVEYLAYLQYWAAPPYCTYLVFPHCLRMLELLQKEPFRTALKRAEFKDEVSWQQRRHWEGRVAEVDDALRESAEPRDDMPS